MYFSLPKIISQIYKLLLLQYCTFTGEPKERSSEFLFLFFKTIISNLTKQSDLNEEAAVNCRKILLSYSILLV